MNFRKTLKRYAVNLRGWRTARKIVVIHSDDWGSIRMPSDKVREKLSSHPLIDAGDRYCINDTLASCEDLEALFEVLTSVRDGNGHHAVITANCVMANPDFAKIRESGFEEYFYEPLEVTFDQYNNLDALSLWKQGEASGIFAPQFHGREHVNVPLWIEKLKSNHEGVRYAFDHNVFAVNFTGLGLRKKNFQAGWDFENASQEEEILRSIREGLTLFENRFGFKSITAIAPSFTWSDLQEKELRAFGVEHMQGTHVQKSPNGISHKYAKHFHFASMDLEAGYQLRNVFFEPSLDIGCDAASDALSAIATAFRMQKPAIISSHRLNFIGSLNPFNRKNGLAQLRKLLSNIVARWPDVEFMSAAELVKLGKSQKAL